MPDLLRRAAALTILSAVGIALLAPMAARSVAPVPADSIQPLLPGAPVSVMVARASLSDRQQAATRRAADGTESVVASAIPTPGSAPMEATLYIVPTPKPTPAPVARTPAAPAAPAGPVDMSNVWDRLAQCESGGNWAINTGNGYYGGLQFNYGTWLSYGGGQYAEYAHLASREQQIATAERLHAARGFQPWPACRRKLGLP